MERIKAIAAGLALALFALPAVSSDLRLELSAGVAKHRLAPEGSWWYDGFPTSIDRNTGAYSVGLLWLPYERGETKIGLRVGFLDLGRVKSDNHFPIHEDGSNLDARVNPNCDRATLGGCKGKYRGYGKARGFYFGPAVERSFGGFTFGAETGLFFYRSQWVAKDWRAYDDAGEFIPAGWDQSQADHMRDVHGTGYIGVNGGYNGLFVSYRLYGNVRASNTDRGKDYVGITSGPLWTLMVGASLPLN